MGTNSDVAPLVCRVPQGSVIGSQSFPMYVQPVCDDDLQIMCDSMIPAIYKLSKCVKNVEKWMLATKLTLYQNKTEFLIEASCCHHHLLANMSATQQYHHFI